jgi:hypothetical protein
LRRLALLRRFFRVSPRRKTLSCIVGPGAASFTSAARFHPKPLAVSSISEQHLEARAPAWRHHGGSNRNPHGHTKCRSQRWPPGPQWRLGCAGHALLGSVHFRMHLASPARSCNAGPQGRMVFAGPIGVENNALGVFRTHRGALPSFFVSPIGLVIFVELYPMASGARGWFPPPTYTRPHWAQKYPAGPRSLLSFSKSMTPASTN